MKRALILFVIGLLMAGTALGGCRRRTQPTPTPTQRPAKIPTPPSTAQIKDPTALRLQEIDVSQLREHRETDRPYPGMTDRYYRLAIDRGAKAVVIPEYGTYFMYWLPDNWDTLEKKRILFLMHGHDEAAAARLHDLYDNAAEYGFGTVTVQWGWLTALGEGYRYLDETVEGMKVSYHIMELALEYIDRKHGVDKELSAWNGFSRSSGHSIVYAYLDKASGNNYFQLFMGIAGGLNVLTPFIYGVAEGEYGPQPVRDQRFYLWCGTADQVQEGRKIEGFPDSVCGRQESARQVLIKRGGIIEKFTATPGGGHMTWNVEPELQKEAIELWLEGTTVARIEEPSGATATAAAGAVEPTSSPEVPLSPLTPGSGAITAIPTGAEPLSIKSFTMDVEDIETGKRLTFNWETTGASEALLVVGTARRFIPWWTVPASGTHSVVLADTLYRNPEASLTAYDEAGNAITEQLTINWPCEYEYFFTPAPDACPLGEPIYTPAADQPFERGRMIWLQELKAEGMFIENTIIVLFNDGLWQQFEDTWTPDQPESDPAIVPPTGLYQPIRGFGKLWRESDDLRERVGWGVAPEFGYEAAWQEQIRESIPAVVYVRTLENRVVRLDGWGMGSGAWQFVVP